MKSHVQSYEIRDCEDFEGVMSIEQIFKEVNEDQPIEDFAAAIKKRFTAIVEENVKVQASQQKVSKMKSPLRKMSSSLGSEVNIDDSE